MRSLSGLLAEALVIECGGLQNSLAAPSEAEYVSARIQTLRTQSDLQSALASVALYRCLSVHFL